MIDLNIELSKCDDWASSTLPERERRYMFEGLPHLMERLLISKARHIRALNAFGIKKMNRNMLALQQNIKTITQDSNDAEFDRAKRFYALFSMSPQVCCSHVMHGAVLMASVQDMLDSIRKKQEFSFDEYKAMLDLQCGVDPTNSEQSAAQATDRNYSLYVIDLHGLELQDAVTDSPS